MLGRDPSNYPEPSNYTYLETILQFLYSIGYSFGNKGVVPSDPTHMVTDSNMGPIMGPWSDPNPYPPETSRSQHYVIIDIYMYLALAGKYSCAD